MSGAILAISGLAGCVCLAIAGIYWGKGGYSSVRAAFPWVVIASLLFAVAAVSAFWYYIVKPEKKTPPPMAEISISSRAVATLQRDQTQPLVADITFLNVGPVGAKNVTGEYETLIQKYPDAGHPFVKPAPCGPWDEIARNGGVRIIRISSLPLDKAIVNAIKDGQVWAFVRVRARFDGPGGDAVREMCSVYREDTLGNAILADCSDLLRPETTTPRVERKN
jgi:hypothetical protein